MSPTWDSFGFDKLSVEDRILLVEAIWDSIAAAPESVPVTDAQKQDLGRRLAAHEADPKAGSTWDEVRAGLGHRS